MDGKENCFLTHPYQCTAVYENTMYFNKKECFESKKLIINNFVRDFKNEKAFGIFDNSGQILVVDILCHISPKLFPDLPWALVGWLVVGWLDKKVFLHKPDCPKLFVMLPAANFYFGRIPTPRLCPQLYV